MGYTQCSFVHISGLKIKRLRQGQLAIAVPENIQIIVNFWMIPTKSNQPSEENKSYIC